jgi:hypothetical protein
MDELEFETLRQRVGRLEAQTRCWKITVSCTLTIASLFFLLGATGQKVPDEIRARRFVALDERGQPRAEMSGEPGFYFFSQTGRRLVELKIQGTTGPNLWMMSEKADESHIRIAAQNDGAFINLAFPLGGTTNNRAGAFLGGLDNGAGVRFNVGGTRSWSTEMLLDAWSHGKPAIRLYDEHHRILWTAP